MVTQTTERPATPTMLPLDEAARRMGVHPATLRRRLHKGVARGTKAQTPQGYVWMVEVDGDDAQAGPTQAASVAEAAPTHDGLAQEVARLSDHVQDLRDQLKAREREVAELHVTLNRVVLALPAPALAPSMNGQAQTQESAAPEWGRRRWWQRLVWG